jgi:hypothetical protein
MSRYDDDPSAEEFEAKRRDFLNSPAAHDLEAKAAFLRRYGKTVPPELLGQMPPAARGACVDLPYPTLTRRPTRVLVMRAAHDSDALWVPVDDDAGCETTRCDWRSRSPRIPWHRYQTPAPQTRPIVVAVRCPNSLTEAEWERVLDESEAQDWIKNNPLGKKTTGTKREDWS